MLQNLLVFSIFNGTAKMKLAILAFLHCREIVKNSINVQPMEQFKKQSKVLPCHSNSFLTETKCYFGLEYLLLR